jgi:hypothetical protein
MMPNKLTLDTDSYYAECCVFNCYVEWSYVLVIQYLY